MHKQPYLGRIEKKTLKSGEIRAFYGTVWCKKYCCTVQATPVKHLSLLYCNITVPAQVYKNAH